MQKDKSKKPEKLKVRFLIQCTDKERTKLAKIIDASGMTRIEYFRKWIQSL